MTEFVIRPSSEAGVVDVEIGDDGGGEVRPKLAVVHRAEASNLPDDWGPGAYVLVDPLPNADGKRSVYIGEATKAGVSSRIPNHLSRSANLESWMLAVVIHGQEGEKVKHRLTYEEAQALESELMQELEKHSLIEVMNKVTPSEPHLTKTKWGKIDSFVKSVVDLLKLMGLDVRKKPKRWAPQPQAIAQTKTQDDRKPDPPAATISQVPSQATEQSSEGKKKHYPEKLQHLVEAGYLRLGDKLVPSSEWNYKGKYFGEGTLIEEDGKIKIEVNGEAYPAPSPAAQAISGNKSEPGWHFLEQASTGKALSRIREEYRRDRGISD